MDELLFYLVILVTNIVQGVTGFAGGILAMPFSSYLIGFSIAVPVINCLGIASGVYVLAEKRAGVDKKTLIHVMALMIPFGVLGTVLRRLLIFDASLLNHILGIIVLFVALPRFVNLVRQAPYRQSARVPKALYELAVCFAGVVHGMYACGGPLLVSYLARALPQKEAFRNTVSAIWVVLNICMLLPQIALGEWNLNVVRILAISLPFLLAGMYLGGRIYKRVSQKAFTLTTYALLIMSGILLLVR